MNLRQELKNAAIFYTIGLPLVILMMIVWGTLTEAAGYLAALMVPVYIVVSVYRWIKDRARA